MPNVDHVANGDNGLPTITSAITIVGNGATIRRDGAVASTFRLFHVVAGGDLTLDETIVSGGVADNLGIGAYGGAMAWHA